MPENRTSKAVEKMYESPLTWEETKAIADKYQRMDKALKESQSAICSEYCGSGSHVGYCLNATEALTFDPLAAK